MLKQIIITALKSKIGKQILSYLLMEFVQWIRKELGLVLTHESNVHTANVNEIAREHNLRNSIDRYVNKQYLDESTPLDRSLNKYDK